MELITLKGSKSHESDAMIDEKKNKKQSSRVQDKNLSSSN